jgi:hypothetical protein
MYRCLRCWLASLWILVCYSLPAYAQTGDGESRSPALPYTFAFLFTLLILVILCSPSRKALRE